MRATDKNFLESTRGRIVLLLRQNPCTVSQLAEKLGVTDNGVRAQLLSLERDGLIQKSGTQPGVRKPHALYELTVAAEELFPKPYAAVLNALLALLKKRLNPDELQELLRLSAHSLAAGVGSNGHSLKQRATLAVRLLESWGGSPKLEADGREIIITSRACPLQAIASQHPEACRLAQELVAAIVGAPVHEECLRLSSPQCRFVIERPL